jgi:hypothetical protein
MDLNKLKTELLQCFPYSNWRALDILYLLEGFSIKQEILRTLQNKINKKRQRKYGIDNVKQSDW